MDLILSNATVVTAHETYQADLGIEGGRIKQIGRGLGPAGRTIDVGGKLVMPGGVDVHTHAEFTLLGEDTVDDFYSSTVQAACGGITTIVDYVLPTLGQSLVAAIEEWIHRASKKTVIDYGLHPTLFQPSDRILGEMAEVASEGYTSFKIFMTGLAEFDHYAPQYLKAMAQAGKLGGMVNIHCEDQCCITYLTQQLEAEGKNDVRHFPDSRPRIAEGIAARRALDMARLADVPAYLVHLSCEEGLDALNDARARGQVAYGETRPIYLHLSRDRFAADPDPERYVGWPPLRDADQMEVLWQALDSSVLQTLASDHTGFSMRQKKLYSKVDELVPGQSALETMLPMLYSEGVRKNRLSLNRFVDVTATTPAKIFGLYPEKGTIAVGSDADLMVFDPLKPVTIRQRDLHSRQDWEIFEGFQVVGWPVMTFSRGDLIVENGKVLAEPGRGRLLKRRHFTQV